MNKVILATAASLCILGLAACNKDDKAAPKAEAKLDSLEQKVSYAIGLNVARGVNAKDFAFDTNAFTKAIEDFRADKDSALTDEEIQATMQTFQTMQREIMTEKRNKMASENLAKGQAFLTEKEAEEGVVKTDSGLMYKVLTKGEGQVPKAEDTVIAHYRGTLLDGTEFDSSYARGEPATFPVGNLIPGWVEALQLMPVGSKWELYIPADLAYGEQGNQAIPPNSTLIFELELLDIQGQEANEGEVNPEEDPEA